MGAKKYTLQPLVEVRRDKADTAKRQLSGAIVQREDRARALGHAEESTEEHRQSVLEGQRQERSALDQGQLRAVDLLRQQAWEIEQERQAQELAFAEQRARQALTEAQQAEEAQRAQTASAMGELEAVERDRRRFVAQQQQIALAKEEEAAEEAWRPRSR